MKDAKRNIAQARISLIIHAEKLDFDNLTAQLGLEPTQTLRKGDVINRLPLIVAETDEWLHTIALTQPEEEDVALNALLKVIGDHAGAVEALRGKASVLLRLSVQSDYAQIAYSLMPETLRKLAATNLPLQVSSLSWGELHI